MNPAGTGNLGFKNVALRTGSGILIKFEHDKLTEFPNFCSYCLFLTYFNNSEFWIHIGFSDFVDPDPCSESRSRIRIQDVQIIFCPFFILITESEEIVQNTGTGTKKFSFILFYFKNLKYKIRKQFT
jgi:hypothetical protein